MTAEVVIPLTQTRASILEAFLLDGADTETVARRAHVTPAYAGQILTDIGRKLGGLSRTELIAAFLRGHVTHTVSHEWGAKGTRRCQECGTPFEATRKDAFLCSANCRRARYAKKQVA